MNEAGQTLTNGTYPLTQQQIDAWGVDNSVLIGYTAAKFNLNIITSPIINITGDLTFGAVEIGKTETKPMVIANEGAADMNVIEITCPDGYTVDWSTGIIKGGANQAVNVTFAPKANQSYTANISVSSNAVSGNNNIAVIGMGIPVAAPPPSQPNTQSTTTTTP
jgi:hypothetical protein